MSQPRGNALPLRQTALWLHAAVRGRHSGDGAGYHGYGRRACHLHQHPCNNPVHVQYLSGQAGLKDLYDQSLQQRVARQYDIVDSFLSGKLQGRGAGQG